MGVREKSPLKIVAVFEIEVLVAAWIRVGLRVLLGDFAPSLFARPALGNWLILGNPTSVIRSE
jgi:hypothetical protein